MKINDRSGTTHVTTRAAQIATGIAVAAVLAAAPQIVRAAADVAAVAPPAVVQVDESALSGAFLDAGQRLSVLGDARRVTLPEELRRTAEVDADEAAGQLSIDAVLSIEDVP